ncbi:nSTAND3 domain-containing NTPase [Flavobacterium mesophilum]|uniref:nSTAND3 domain-containing NTPase n=1 Tax=Flavobacterium mesophilum TaxID=3143495 RepID=UPI0031D89786
MSVATEGVKGYEYQYKVTVLFGLLHCNDFKSQLYVEKIGSEDITFIDENNNHLEIQIKRERNNIDFSKIIEWLSHFQERSSTNNLLLRVKDKKSKCLFITRSRCNDEILMFLKEFPSIDSNENSISKEVISKLKKELKGIKFKDTPLEIKRKTFCIDISNKLNKSDIETLINNTLIWEQIGEEKIDNEVLKCLNKKFSVPQSLSDNLYLRLLEIVKQGRDAKEDIIPLFKNLILKLRTNRYSISENNIDRKEEAQAVDILEKSNLLLLTGISQCGKTELAKKIANNFIDIGYTSIPISTDFFQVENFFNQNKIDDKILIFEDPFGHIKPKKESHDVKNKIINLVKHLSLNHKIIVTSRIEILEEAFDSCNIVENVLDLTEYDNKLILDFWEKFSNAQSVNNEIKNIVGEYILGETEHKIQVGQLDYLSRYDLNKLKVKSISELISIARHNSTDIANDVLKENNKESKILAVMSICCSNSTGINAEDLKYILSEDQNKYSVFKESKVFQFKKGKNKFPKYLETNKLKKGFKASISYFEERGFIKFENNKYFFSHPNYFEAGKKLFFRRSSQEQKENIGYLKKAIVCISPVTTLIACKLLTWIYRTIDSNFKDEIKDLMFLSNKSIFPAVEDYSSINLINIIEDINNEDQKNKIINIVNRGNTDSSSIKWFNDEVPFLSKRDDDLRNLFVDKISPKEIEEIENKVLNNQHVNLFDIWRYINYHKIVSLSKVYTKFDHNIINSLLKHEEVFIRKQVAKLFFLSKINVDEIYLIKKIFSDEHPTVSFYGIWGSFLSWNKQIDEIKTIIFKDLKKLFQRQEISIRANDLMTTFSIDYSGECIDWEFFSKEETIELWNVWAQIFPVFSKSLPPNISLNYGRYGATMETAMKYLTLHNGIKVFETWLNRIELRIQANIELSDYEMAISDELISFTNDNFKIRENLIERILSNKNSIFCLYNLKLTIKHWDKLNRYEKDIILNLIDSKRNDVVWIKAMLLLEDEIPKEIEIKIVGDINFYLLKPVKVFEILSEELIHSCLQIIYVQPYELEYLRPNYVSDFWAKIINRILFYEIEPHFDICIKAFINHNIYRRRPENFLLWRKICLNSKNINYLTYIIIYNISRGSINVKGTSEMIINLIYAYKKRNDYEVFLKIIAEEIEVLQLNYHKEEIFDYFGKDLIFNDLYKMLYPDLIVKMIIEKAGIWLLSEITSELRSFRFFISYLVIEKLVNERDEIDEETREKLFSIPNNIEKVGEEKRKILKSKYFEDKILKNWSK